MKRTDEQEVLRGARSKRQVEGRALHGNTRGERLGVPLQLRMLEIEADMPRVRQQGFCRTCSAGDVEHDAAQLADPRLEGAQTRSTPCEQLSEVVQSRHGQEAIDG